MNALAPEADSLAGQVLAALAAQDTEAAVSLPRLGKQLRLEASVVLRELSLMGSARIVGAVISAVCESAHGFGFCLPGRERGAARRREPHHPAL
ncbi:MAG: hypothetical protein EOP39_22460, partial [Rubrivivax sp.]